MSENQSIKETLNVIRKALEDENTDKIEVDNTHIIEVLIISILWFLFKIN